MDEIRLLDRILVRTASVAGAGYLGAIAPIPTLQEGLAMDQGCEASEIQSALDLLVKSKRLAITQTYYSIAPVAWWRWEQMRKDGALGNSQTVPIDPSKFIY